VLLAGATACSTNAARIGKAAPALANEYSYVDGPVLVLDAIQPEIGVATDVRIVTTMINLLILVPLALAVLSFQAVTEAGARLSAHLSVPLTGAQLRAV
jgi:hypothetical protein